MPKSLAEIKGDIRRASKIVPGEALRDPKARIGRTNRDLLALAREIGVLPITGAPGAAARGVNVLDQLIRMSVKRLKGKKPPKVPPMP